MQFINSIMSWLMKKRFHQIELFIKYPFEVQQEWLEALLNKAKDTSFGKKYDFNNIKNYSEFKNKVPINTYESIHPYIEQIMRGDKDVLWPGTINYFAKSSGTTNSKSKFIPVSQDALDQCHYKGGKDMLTIYCHNNAQSNLFNGKNLALGGSLNINDMRATSNSYSGDLSAIIMNSLPFWAEFYRVPSKDVAMLNNWEEKLEKLYASCVNEEMVSLCGVPSWMYVFSKYALEQSKKDNLLELWPQLEVFFHGGISFEPYKNAFNKLIPTDTFKYYQTYNASEGFFGIQMNNDDIDMLLMLDYGIFYEFAEIDTQGEIIIEKVMMLDDIKINTPYALIISTNAGLWRYAIGDVISFTSLSPHKIKLLGRTKHFINAFGEELMIHNAESALTTVSNLLKIHVKDYTAAPVFIENSAMAYHHWLIELEEPFSDITLFASYLDAALKKLNSDYEAKRQNNLLLQMPVITVAKNNAFYNWLKANNRLGGQYKVPRLLNDSKLLNQILTFNK